MLLLEHVLVAVTQVHDRAHVHLVIGGQHGGRVLRVLQATGNRLAQAGHLHALFANLILFGRNRTGGSSGNRSSGGCRNTLGDGSENVALQNLATLARTVNLIGRQVVFSKQLAGGRCRRHGAGCRSGNGGRCRCGSRSRLCGRCSGCSAGGTFGDLAEKRVETDGLAVLRNDFGENAGRRRRDFNGNLVGFQFNERFVGLDGIADLLEPGAYGRFADGFAEGWYADFSGHDLVPLFRCLFCGAMRESSHSPSASSRNAASCARCLDIRPVAGEAAAGRPV
ncbi:hypothetical protein D3C71_1217500 [compost metagenome]